MTMKWISGILLAVFFVGYAFGEQPESVAYMFLQKLVNQNFEEALGMCSSAVRQQLTADALKNIWSSLERQIGVFKNISKYELTTQSGYDVVIFTTEFEHGNISIIVSVDKDGNVSGLFFQEAAVSSYRFPSYVNLDGLEKEEIYIGHGEWKLPGELVVPKGDGPFPALVLIHGSGPNDMDETIGPNKVFKDIAYGLASRGVAVLRYHKRTYVYGSKIDPVKITVEEEVIEDAVNAVEELRKRGDIGKIFILGHSLGGMLAPEIAMRSRADGAILVAAPARPLGKVILDQLHHLVSLNLSVDRTQFELLEKLVNHELPPEAFVIGAPASYYYDLEGRKPVETATSFKKPMLLIRCGRDYQVTAKDFNIWKDALESRENVTFVVFEDLNHLMISGEGTPAPVEYLREGHVDEKVIETVSNWIFGQL